MKADNPGMRRTWLGALLRSLVVPLDPLLGLALLAAGISRRGRR
jgi:hypothetical protein